MTIHIVPNQQSEGSPGKIGPWDVLELRELVASFHELGSNVERMLDQADESEAEPVHVENVRRALLELTKGLAGVVVAGAPELAGELAKSCLVYWGSSGTRSEEVKGAAEFEPVRVSVLSTETRKHETTGHVVDVALLRVAYYDAEARSEPSMVDALLVRRDRANDDRRVRYFPTEVNSQHFDRAVECRAQWLGVSDGPFAGSRQ